MLSDKHHGNGLSEAPPPGANGSNLLVAPRGNLSYVRGDISVSLITDTIPEVFKSTAERFSERTAAVFCEESIRWTWRELREKVEQAAAGLSAAGIQKGDRIGIWAPNRSEWLLTQLAAMELGAILVNINPANLKEELRHTITQVGMKALVCADTYKRVDFSRILRELAPELNHDEPGFLNATALPTLRTVIIMGEKAEAGMFRFSDILEAGREAALPNDALAFNEPINIQFTSGTTGKPKAATLTHFNIINNAKSVAAAMNLSENDRLCVPVPLFHCFGMVMGVLACVNTGACMVFPSENFNAQAVMKAIDREKCTALYGVPTMFIAQLDEPSFHTYDFSSLRTGIMAGAPCPIETMKRVVEDMHIPELTIAYGMTETSPVSFQSTVDDSLERRVHTVGRVLPHIEVKIVDKDGEIVPVGTPGELCTKGYSVMAGYWGEREKTDEAIRDGWMKTGDIAVIDRDGYCKIVGRIKDMIIRGGENIYPREIEEFLFSHPKVAAVQVFGVPSKRYGETVAAWIIPKVGESIDDSEIREFCDGRIARYKTPQHIRIVDSYPLTVSGKPQKFKMRDAMMAELGLSEVETA